MLGFDCNFNSLLSRKASAGMATGNDRSIQEDSYPTCHDWNQPKNLEGMGAAHSFPETLCTESAALEIPAAVLVAVDAPRLV